MRNQKKKQLQQNIDENASKQKTPLIFWFVAIKGIHTTHTQNHLHTHIHNSDFSPTKSMFTLIAFNCLIFCIFYPLFLVLLSRTQLISTAVQFFRLYVMVVVFVVVVCMRHCVLGPRHLTAHTNSHQSKWIEAQLFSFYFIILYTEQCKQRLLFMLHRYIVFFSLSICCCCRGVYSISIHRMQQVILLHIAFNMGYYRLCRILRYLAIERAFF